MRFAIQTVDTDVFVVTGVFLPEECADLIARAEAIGFEPASVRTDGGPKMITNIRNNDRVNLVDESIAAEMWRRVKDHLPVLDGELPVGVDSHLRFYRYVPGQQFRRHKDGAVTNPQGQTSKLSYLIYLNDDCAGGDTAFVDYSMIEGRQEKKIVTVSPATGNALLFRHERWHEGTPVEAGVKYVLRTDVFYGDKDG